jgi:hypothetical protein
MEQPPDLRGSGFLVLANGDQYAANYDLSKALAPISKPGRWAENRRYRGVLNVFDYADRVIPAATHLVLDDGRRFALRSAAVTRRSGIFEIQTGVTAEAGAA